MSKSPKQSATTQDSSGIPLQPGIDLPIGFKGMATILNNGIIQVSKKTLEESAKYDSSSPLIGRVASPRACDYCQQRSPKGWFDWHEAQDLEMFKKHAHCTCRVLCTHEKTARGRNALLSEMQKAVDERAAEYTKALDKGTLEEHSWMKHRTDSTIDGTHFPKGITKTQFFKLAEQIFRMPRVQAAFGNIDPELVYSLNNGLAALYEKGKSGVENLFAQIGGVRYQFRIKPSITFHPIDGEGVTRREKPKAGQDSAGKLNDMPWGSRPVDGWNRPKTPPN
jgi:hypothetical protein